jgi:hypothetical protein
MFAIIEAFNPVVFVSTAHAESSASLAEISGKKKGTYVPLSSDTAWR